MNKKLLSLVLSLVMVLGTFTSAFAAETTTTTTTDEKLGEKVETVEKITGKDNKIQYIIDKKFVDGYENGDYGYDKEIKRSEITKLIVFANGNKELAEKLQGSMKLYNDVDTAFWANGVISVGTTVPSSANGQAMLNGYPTGEFKPEKNVTYAELSKMLVVLVKEDLTADMIKDANAKWATQWMSWAAQLGILDDVTVANSDAPATRADAFTMLYNALYKMQSFKRVPANEKVGVLSELNKSKLTLNQDSEQVYTITDDTVFVNNTNDRSNTIKVKSITNPDYYYGSLVRVMFNDKKEVTHILELGNPEKMALGLSDGVVGKNSRWNGVADSTISTKYTANIETLKEKTKLDPKDTNGYVSVNFKNSNTDVKSITFHDVKNTSDKAIATYELRINDDTKVYVANPYNNQMKELKDIYEALRLIGYENKYDVVPNVYAGFDKASTKDVAYDPAISAGTETAKVVVFNVVSKDKGGDLYRVINSSTSTGNATLEDVDGKTYDKSFWESYANFPYNYGDLHDVVEVYGGTNSSVVTKLDHSDTKEYPIVKVTDVNGKLVTVEGIGERSAVINITDADIFTSKGPKLEEGALIQIRAAKDAKDSEDRNMVEIVSIMPDRANWKVAGNIENLLSATNNREVYTIGIRTVSEFKSDWRFTTNQIDSNTGTSEDYRGATFKVGEKEGKALDNLKTYLEKNGNALKTLGYEDLQEDTVRLFFISNRNKDADLAFEASDIQVYVNKVWVDLDKAEGLITTIVETGADKAAAQAVQNKIDALNPKAEIVANVDYAAVKEAEDAFKGLDAKQQKLVDTTKMDEARAEITAQEDAEVAVAAYEAAGATDETKKTDAETAVAKLANKTIAGELTYRITQVK
ncbi:S-layer homology domain-containing protein [Anaerosphaera aminiphila DSM 21120]|uniref:S-layer homology domain-containing protein n=1 Tax=Anaerosphaera aminiphila DSM 21120 TaxID=1120995 RepID=A0A1M5TT48_9FIRM|nr:hypothetical protein [Anaerosphaera aminiphila]SHH53962.1 S-layer homology domain-containing protein [Anaerosphaera aminiphila DSM 21120]